MMRWSKTLVVLSCLALLLALAGPALAADTTKGVIKNFSTNHKQFVMTDENGTDWTFHIGDNVQVFSHDKATSFDNLRAGDKVLITYAKEGNRLTASEIRVKGSAESTGLTTEGRIKSIDMTNNEFVLTDKNGKDWMFRVSDSTKVMTSNNRSEKLTDLKRGERVKVHYNKKGNDLWANEVRETHEE